MSFTSFAFYCTGFGALWIVCIEVIELLTFQKNENNEESIANSRILQQNLITKEKLKSW